MLEIVTSEMRLIFTFDTGFGVSSLELNMVLDLGVMHRIGNGFSFRVSRLELEIVLVLGCLL